MDAGHAVLFFSQLILGAVAAFLAILLWSKTRDLAWMFMVAGVIAAYIEVIYSILNTYGFIAVNRLLIGSVPLLEIILPLLKMSFFIAAFYVMVFKRRRR